MTKLTEKYTKRDSLRDFGREFQTKCITTLVSDRSFIEQIQDIVELEFFESDSARWIVNETLEYFRKYKSLPSLVVFKTQVDGINTESQKKSVIDMLKLVYGSTKDEDLVYIKERFLEFCKNQKIKKAVLDSVDYLIDGDYDKIKATIDNAMKAGLERNVGHEYLAQIDDRMSVMARNTIQTNWKEIDTIMDGGLAPGELGIITACAGAGKCVGPNTEIEIQYHEIGIEVEGNSGNPYVIWLSPFKKYDFMDKELYGWQIENVLYELEKMKAEYSPNVEVMDKLDT